MGLRPWYPLLQRAAQNLLVLGLLHPRAYAQGFKLRNIN